MGWNAQRLLLHMLTRARRTLLMGLHQLTVTTGILLLPVAILARRIGLRLPAGRFVDATTEACENAMR